MKQRFLGRTGLLVSELCMGAMTFGRELDEQHSFRLLDHFVDSGGTCIDTADIYSQGESERVVGKWLADKPRQDLVIATKVRFAMGDAPNDTGLSRKHILDGIDRSLRRLGCEYIDLYQVHCWDWGTPLEETLATLNGLVQAGKVRYIGVSNFKAHQIQRAIDMSRENGWERFASLQPLYNLLDRALEWEIVELCLNEGLGIIPWSPLRGGWLTGKYRREMKQPPAGTRIAKSEAEGWSESWSNYANERTWNVVETLLSVAKELGKSAAQVALNWVKDRPGVTAPIIGASSLEQLKDNLGCIGWTIPPELMKRLDEASAMPGPYPFDFIQQVGSLGVSRKHTMVSLD